MLRQRGMMTRPIKEAELAQWLIYVARPRRRADGTRSAELSERSGFVMQVSSYRLFDAGRDLYRVQVERVADVYAIRGRIHMVPTFAHHPRHRDPSTFQVTISTAGQTATFGPEGLLGMLAEEDKGRGVGRYCLSRVIHWLRDHYASYRVLPRPLSAVDARTLEERKRRDRFYAGAGFDLTFTGDGSRGTFSKSHAGALLSHWRRGRVRELDTGSLSDLQERLKHRPK
jgi:hypothetical protein